MKKKAKVAPKQKVKKTSQKKNNTTDTSRLGEVLSFRWLKKMVNSQFKSLDLLDQWILKRRLASLFL